MKWITYIRGMVPLYRVYPVLSGSKGLITVVFYNNGREMIFAWDAAQLKERSKEITLTLAKDLEDEIKSGIKISEGYLTKNITSKNAVKLWHELYDNVSLSLGRANMYIDAYDEFPIEPAEPRYTSYVARLNNRLHDLKKDFSEQKLEKIRKEYWWTSLGWENLKDMGREDILKRLEEDHQRIEEVETGDDLSSIFAELHDIRKELQMKSAFAFLKILKVIAEDRGFPLEDMEWLMPDELENPDLKIARQRRKKMFFLVGDKIELIYGKEAEKRGNNLLNFDKADMIKGKVAYHGHVKGRARVCKGVHEAMNLKEGEILITGMTMPDYVPYMKRAAAVVTNEGGLTCHAGIICREFRIPCIVGTIHATEIFKTGDFIEVDAEKGVVKVIR